MSLLETSDPQGNVLAMFGRLERGEEVVEGEGQFEDGEGQLHLLHPVLYLTLAIVPRTPVEEWWWWVVW